MTSTIPPGPAQLERVGYLVSRYPTVNHTYILREIRALRALGMDVIVVSVRSPDRMSSELGSEEVEERLSTKYILDKRRRAASVAQLLLSNLTVFASRPLTYLGVVVRAFCLTGGAPRLIPRYAIYVAEAAVACAHFRKRGVTHFHTHFSTTVALLAARLSGLTFSMTIHGPAELQDASGFHMAEKVNEARGVVAISRFAASQIKRVSSTDQWEKIVVLPLGIDPHAFRRISLPSQSIGSRAFRLLSVGRLSPEKAQVVMIEAVRLLCKRGRDVELTLVGDGPSRNELELAAKSANVENRVRFAGACNSDRVVKYLEECDVFILSSFAEGVPVVLMEAMAMEIPCVSTWVAGIPELIEDEADGLLIPPDSGEAIAEAVSRLHDEPELRRRIGTAARKKVLSSFDLSQNTARLADHIKGILADR